MLSRDNCVENSKCEIFWIFLCNLLRKTQRTFAVLYFRLRLASICHIIYLISNSGMLLKKKQNLFFLKLFTQFAWSFSNFKKNRRAIISNASRIIFKKRTWSLDFKGIYFFTNFFRNIPILNFTTVHWVGSELSKSERLIWRSKYC